MAIARAAASTARPTSSLPISRVLNGNVAAASATRTLWALGKIAEYGLGVGSGETVGKRLPSELVGLCGPGSSSEEPGFRPPDTVGRIPPGSVAPMPRAGLVAPAELLGDGERDGDVEGFAATVIAPDAGGGDVAFPALAVADMITCLPAAVLVGTVTDAWSSSEVPLAIPPAVQVTLLAVGQTVNFGVTDFPSALALMVTSTLLAAPPAGHTQIA
jgi:hypothetical protein